MLSMFLMSFLGSTLMLMLVGEELRSKEAGEVQLGGDTGGLEAPVDLGVMLLNAEGPETELGECIEDVREVLREEEAEEGDTLE